MNRQALFAALALAAAITAQADDAHHQPRHGGVVVEAKAFDLELVARPTTLQLHLREHGGKVMDVAKTSARLTLLSGADKQAVALQPAGDKLEATGSFKVGAGTKVVAVVTHGGKPTTARFTLK